MCHVFWTGLLHAADTQHDQQSRLGGIGNGFSCVSSFPPLLEPLDKRQRPSIMLLEPLRHLVLHQVSSPVQVMFFGDERSSSKDVALALKQWAEVRVAPDVTWCAPSRPHCVGDCSEKDHGVSRYQGANFNGVWNTCMG